MKRRGETIGTNPVFPVALLVLWCMLQKSLLFVIFTFFISAELGDKERITVKVEFAEKHINSELHFAEYLFLLKPFLLQK